MDLFEAISRRHSYRGPFKDQMIPHEDLIKIMQAGLNAPSGCNAQTTRFVIVDDPEIVSKIRALHASNEAMQQAQAYILCFIDGNPEPVYEGCNFVIEDCAAAVENMLLAVTALGYASVWVDGWVRCGGRAGKIGEMVGAPEGKTLRIVLPLGVPLQQWSPKEKKPFEQRARFNRFPD